MNINDLKTKTPLHNHLLELTSNFKAETGFTVCIGQTIFLNKKAIIFKRPIYTRYKNGSVFQNNKPDTWEYNLKDFTWKYISGYGNNTKIKDYGIKECSKFISILENEPILKDILQIGNQDNQSHK